MGLQPQLGPAQDPCLERARCGLSLSAGVVLERMGKLPSSNILFIPPTKSGRIKRWKFSHPLVKGLSRVWLAFRALLPHTDLCMIRTPDTGQLSPGGRLHQRRAHDLRCTNSPRCQSWLDLLLRAIVRR